jgi:hypothetical protein
MDVGSVFPAGAVSFEAVESVEGALDDPAVGAQAGAVTDYASAESTARAAPSADPGVVPPDHHVYALHATELVLAGRCHASPDTPPSPAPPRHPRPRALSVTVRLCRWRVL